MSLLQYVFIKGTTKINYGVDTRGKKKKRTSKKNVDGRCMKQP